MSAPTSPSPATAPLLDLDDIQGIVLRGNAYHYARYCFFEITDAKEGREFVSRVSQLVTNSRLGPDGRKQPRAMTIAFTWQGLRALGVPARSLDSFPLDFKQGMAARADILRDFGEDAPANWEPLWRSGRVHVMVAVYSHAERPGEMGEKVDMTVQVRADKAELKREFDLLMSCDPGPGVTLLDPVQDAGMLVLDGRFVNKEHFGYSDGYSQPDIEGSGAPLIRGGGKWDETSKTWLPIAAGEFVLGQRDEAGEIPIAPVPNLLSRNGTFMVYRKLHQKVKSFRDYLRRAGQDYPGGAEQLAAKMVGRWRDGTPLVTSPDRPYPDRPKPRIRSAEDLAAALTPFTDFRYGYDPGPVEPGKDRQAEGPDPYGSRCPLGSHARRMNPRDSLGFGGTLVNRRRLLRRGLPYGDWQPEGREDDDGEHGVIMMPLNASIERQFEFVQREWANYGNDFHQGNDPDPLIGNHPPGTRMVIPGDPATGRPPHICPAIPQFVVNRGGDYFFVPSLTALRLIAEGKIEQA